jgi:hypothetical protein
MIELLLVVGIFLILFTLYWGHGPSKRNVQLGSCRQNLEKIYLAMEIYARDNKDQFPVATGAVTSEDALALLVPRYTSDTMIFICPASKDSFLPGDKSFRDGKISYAYYMGRRRTDVDRVVMSDAQVDAHSKSAGATVFSTDGKPPGNNHGKDGGNFLMCEGSVLSSGGDAPFSLNLTESVVLLNPKVK